MNHREWNRVSTPIAKSLPEYRPMKRGFFREHEWMAECLYADSSAFTAERFYLEAFVLPFFVPADDLDFEFGFRVGNSYWETIDDHLVSAVTEAMSRLRQFASIPALVRRASDWDTNVYHLELCLCASVIEADDQRFDLYQSTLSGWHVGVDWEQDVVDRCMHFAELANRDRGVALTLLSRRREETRALLR